MALHPTIRQTVSEVATHASNGNILKRSKLAFDRLEKQHPELVKNYSFKKLYANICYYRRTKGIAKKHTKKVKIAKRKTTKRSASIGLIDLVTFININKATIVAMTKIDPNIVAKYERIRAQAKKDGLEIVVKNDEIHLVPTS